MTTKPKIVPYNKSGNKTGYLSHKLTPAEISERLGFESNIDDDPAKVIYSWGFKVDDVHCAIWDYKESRWSTFGPADALRKVFPTEYFDNFDAYYEHVKANP